MSLQSHLTIKSTHRHVRVGGWDMQSSRHNGNCKAPVAFVRSDIANPKTYVTVHGTLRVIIRV